MTDKAAKNQEISRRVNRMLPDDPREALAAIALCYANVVVATGCDDESAVGAFRVALRQMRAGMPLAPVGKPSEPTEGNNAGK